MLASKYPTCRDSGVGKSSIINALRFNALTADQGLSKNLTALPHSHASDEEGAQQLAERLESHAEAGVSGSTTAVISQAGEALDLTHENSVPWQGGMSLGNISDAASRSPEGMQVCTDLQLLKPIILNILTLLAAPQVFS